MPQLKTAVHFSIQLLSFTDQVVCYYRYCATTSNHCRHKQLSPMDSISTALTTMAVVASIVAAAIRFLVKFGRCSRPNAKPIRSRKSLFRLSTHPNNQTICTRKPSLSLFVCQYQFFCSLCVTRIGFQADIVLFVPLFPCFSWNQ